MNLVESQQNSTAPSLSTIYGNLPITGAEIPIMPKILVADDETLLRETVARYLEKIGYSVTRANNGQQGGLAPNG
jgi:PleD family two-component response regulator